MYHNATTQHTHGGMFTCSLYTAVKSDGLSGIVKTTFTKICLQPSDFVPEIWGGFIQDFQQCPYFITLEVSLSLPSMQ